MKNVYLIDYSQITRLNLISHLLEPSISFIKSRHIIKEQGGNFLEINNSMILEKIKKNHSNGIIYQYAINKISTEQFANAMSVLFKLDNLKFIQYWENILNINNLPLIALEQLAQLQQDSDFAVHLAGNITQLNADALNIKIAFTGLKNIQYTYSFTEGALMSSDYLTKLVADKYPNKEYNIIDLRSRGMLTPEIFKVNSNETTGNQEIITNTENTTQASNTPALTP